MNKLILSTLFLMLTSLAVLQAQCPNRGFFVSSDACSNDAVVFTPAPSCALSGAGGTVADLFIYDGGNAPAPAGYENAMIAPGTCVTSADPFQDGLLTLVSAGNGCEVMNGLAIENLTCDVITITYFIVAADSNLDTDGDGCFEYSPTCEIIRHDVVIYPFMTIATTDGCLPTADLVAADGTVCATQTATTFDCKTPFNYDFSDYYAGGAGPATGSGCVIPPAGTVTRNIPPPGITCPPNTAVTCGSLTEPILTGMAMGLTGSGCLITENPVTVDFTDSSTQGNGCSAYSYTITRAWTATDACGNVSNTCYQTIEVEDTEAPIITCPASEEFSCEGPFNPTQFPTATDNCLNNFSQMSFDYTDDLSGLTDCNGSGVILRSWTATDACGNVSAPCIQVVTIFDDEAPTIDCLPGVEYSCEGPFDPTEFPTATDNCAQDNGVDITYDYFDDMSGLTACGGTGVIIREWFATDACGNISPSCIQTLTVVDNEAPTIDCPAGGEYTCEGPFDPTQFPTATDNCSQNNGEITYDYVDDLSGLTSCNGTGIILREWTATDACGNISAPCFQTLTIIDIEAPVLTCPPNVVVECGDSIDPADTGMATAVDNCATAEADIIIEFTDASNQLLAGCGLTNYTITRTWRVVDACGNLGATCTQEIDIIDTTPPVLTCPADVVIGCADDTDPSALGMATATDNCTPEESLTISFADGDPTGDLCSQTFERTWRVVDQCGSIVSCVQVITLLDETGPVIIEGSNMTVECDGTGNELAFQQWLNNNGGATAEDDCGLPVAWTYSTPSLLEGCGAAGIYEVIFTATDGCGNEATTAGIFTIEDTDAPEITTSPISLQVQCGEENPTAGFNEWIANNGGAVAEDFCGNITWTTLPENPQLKTTCGLAGVTPVTFVATDDCGNEVSVPAIYIIVDGSGPTFTGILEDMTMDCDEVAEFDTPTASDNCSDGVSLSFEDVTTPGDCPNEFSITRTWIATDECGNQSAPTSQTIYFEDNIAPTINFVDPALVGTPDGGTITFACDDIQVFTTAAVEAFDNCSSTNFPNGNYNENTDGINETGVYTELEIKIFDSITYDAENEDECGPGGLYQQMICTWTAIDACGNEGSITIYMNFVDEVAPEFTSTPEDITVTCGEILDIEAPTTSDNCSNHILVTFEDETTTGCDPGVVTTRTWTASDICGNTSQVSQTITVIDNVNPVFTSVPADTTVGCNGSGTFEDAIAEDQCSDVTVTFEDTSSTEECNTVTTRTWTATDACGNTATASATITATDVDAPTISEAQSMTIACGSSDSDLNNWLAANGGASASDDCSSITWSNNYNPANSTGEDCSAGILNSVAVTFTAADACGNTAITTATFTTTSGGTPSFTFVPENGTVDCGATPQFGTPTASDDCGEVTITSEVTSSQSDCDVVHTITWTATNACGNSATASQSLTAADGGTPSFTFVPADATIGCGESPSFGTPTAQDDCGNANITSSVETTQNGCEVLHTITWTATDGCGNATTASQTITAIDTAAPSFDSVPTNQSLSCGGGGVTWGDPVVSDACGTVNVTFTDSGSANCNGGSITRTWTATDECGNVTTASATANVAADNTPPTISSIDQDIIAQCNQDIPWQVPTATDNCGGEVTLTHETVHNGGTCATGYDVTCTWTATDACGNTSTATQVAWVYPTGSNNSMLFTYIPPNLTRECGDAIEFGEPIGTSSCVDFDLTYEDEVTEGNCAGTMVYTRNWTATNDCDGTATCTQQITVVDSKAPYFTHVPEGGQITCGTTPEFGTPLCDDDCGHVSETTFEDVVEQTCGASYNVTRTWTISDACGNTATTSTTYEVIDDAAPAFTTNINDKEIVCGQEMSFDTPAATDQCGGSFDLTFEDQASADNCQVDYSVTRTWTATDECGNASTIAQTITRQADNVAPTFTATPSDMVIDCNTTPEFGTPTVEDNCSQVEMTYNDVTSTGDCSTGYTITRTWSATDACGNEVTTSATITVSQENTLAFANVPADQLINCGTDMNFGTPVVNTNCSEDAVITYEDATVEGTCASSYAVTRTWSATACNITVTAAATITVEDNQLPSFDMLPENKEITCGVTPQFDTPLFSDNCSNVEIAHTDATATQNCEVATTRTWTITDACGNVATAAQTITSVDNDAPVFVSTPDNLVIDCSTTPTFDTPVVNDNCGQVEVTFEDVISAGDCATGYTITRTWSAIDQCGNTTSTSAMITVSEETTIAFANVPADQLINCGTDMNFGTPEISSNCSEDAVITYEDATIEGTCASSYAVTRTWSATACNITVTAAATITVEDNQLPTFDMLPENKEIACGVTPQFDTPLFSDNCSNVEIAHTDATATQNCEVATTRTWTITDACGNVATAAQTITSVDNDAPVFASTPESIVVDCNTTPTFGIPVVEDDCGQVEMTYNDVTSTGDCATGSGYTVTRTWTAVDGCGNETTTSQVVTVTENTTVAFSNVPSDQLINCDDNMSFGTPEIASNCSEDAMITYEDVMVEGTCATNYAVTRTWTATACNITVTAAATITVEDTQLPAFDMIPTDKFVACGEIMEFDTPLYSDNCSDVTISHTDATNTASCETGMVMTRTWTIADACGNIATAAQTVTREADTDAPTFSQIPQGGTVNCEGNFEFGTPVVADNCSEVTTTFEDQVIGGTCETGYTFTRTWTASDACGNTAIAEQTFSIETDQTAPEFTFVPQDEVVTCDVIIEDQFGTPEAMDACGSEVAITHEDVSVTLECGMMVTRTWIAADACGNITTATKSVTVEDTVVPEIVFAPADKALSCGVEIPLEDASFADNCDANFEVTFEETTEQTTCGYKLYRTWTAVDGCNNTTSTSQTIEVTDDVAPIFDLTPADQEMTYNQFFEWTAPAVTAQDECTAVTVSQPIVTDNGDCDNFKYFVTWNANDECGNTIEHTMTIPISDAKMEVSLDAPNEIIVGNEDMLVANVEFGLAPYSYDWTILEGQDWTIDSDGNLANISAGNQNATFEVKVTDAHGCERTTIVEVASAENETTAEFFEILPNPSYGDLNINYTSELDVTSKVAIYDMLGRRLHTWKFDAVKGINKNQLDVTPLANATYVITVEVGERYYHRKFVKLAK